MVIGQQDGQRLEPNDLGFQGGVLAPAGPVRPPEPDVDFPGQQPRYRLGHPAAVQPAEVDVGCRIASGFEDQQAGPAAFAQEIRHVRSGSRAELPQRCIVKGEELAGANEKALARGRQRDATRRPREELRPELALESGDVAAQGLLGDEEPRRRAREVELLRRRDEVSQRSQVELTSDRRRFVIHAMGTLIPRVKVLDLERRRCDAGHEINSPGKENSNARRRRSRHTHHRSRPRSQGVRLVGTVLSPLAAAIPPVSRPRPACHRPALRGRSA